MQFGLLLREYSLWKIHVFNLLHVLFLFLLELFGCIILGDKIQF